MHERSGMNDLDDRTEPHCSATFISTQFGCKQKQRRTDAFSAAFAQVVTDLSDDLNAGDRVMLELALNGQQIVTQKIKYLFSGGASAGGSRQVQFL